MIELHSTLVHLLTCITIIVASFWFANRWNPNNKSGSRAMRIGHTGVLIGMVLSAIPLIPTLITTLSSLVH
jgi:hypothetical protein